MKRFDLELAVGIFLLIGIAALGYLSIKLGKMEVLGNEGYTVHAEFVDAGGIKAGSVVEIAGVQVGKVQAIMLDKKDFQASVSLVIDKGVEIQDDAIASVKTKGIIGEKFIKLTPGGSDVLIKNGGTIRETESSVDLESIVAKYAFGKV
jgi:phospholipid/cholesterol/gamma-HCH transport system substrate-binding protein